MLSPEWKGETVFIVAGGPSVASQNTDLLKGRKVIVINSSWERLPWAPVLFFGDDRWWREYSKEVLAGFPGRIITCAPEVRHPRFLKLKRAVHENQLCPMPDTVMVRRTSMTGAMNVAMHLGAAIIVLLGLDGKPGADGRLHHHEEYSMSLGGLEETWQEQRRDLSCARASLAARGITVVNASPVSALADLWPIVPFEAYL